MERQNRGYQEDKVVAQINRKADINVNGRQIQEIIGGKGDVGIGTKGKIDFLVNYCGFIHIYVAKFKY